MLDFHHIKKKKKTLLISSYSTFTTDPSPWQPLTCFRLYGFAYFKFLYKWNHKTCGILWLASFNKHNQDSSMEHVSVLHFSWLMPFVKLRNWTSPPGLLSLFIWKGVVGYWHMVSCVSWDHCFSLNSHDLLHYFFIGGKLLNNVLLLYDTINQP